MLLNAYHSKSVKYTKSIPKSNKNLVSISQELKEAADVFNKALMSESFSNEKLKITKIYTMIKVRFSLYI